MNALTPLPRRPPPPRAPRPRRSDQEFLAPALEILETPASPIRMWMILTICALAAITLAWTYIGRIDVIATAAGKIEPTGKVKVIQPLQTGKIARLLVENGDHVSAGQMIVQLDKTETESQLTDATEQLEAAKAEMARRNAAIKLVSSVKPDTTDIAVPAIAWSADIPALYRVREQGVLVNDLLQLQDALSSSTSQIAQKQADAASIAATIEAQQGLDDTLTKLTSMRKTLVSKEAGSEADWLDALQTEKTQEVVLATDVEQQTDNITSIDVLRQGESKAIGDFLADYTQKLADAEKTTDDLEQKVRQAQSQLDQMTLQSPIDGIVQASAVTTVGQVVTTGQELMRIVPAASSIDIQAYLPNDEIGFVSVGQTAAVKIAAFPYTQYGTIPGHVTSVGRDAVTAADAEQALEDPTHVSSAADVAGTADQTDNLVFPITVRLDRDFITVNGTAVPFSPGMGASVDIDTGNRRILEYLFSPVIDVTSSALHER